MLARRRYSVDSSCCGHCHQRECARVCGAAAAGPALLTRSGSLPSSTGLREAERFGTPPGRASSITRAGKEDSSGVKYKAGRVSRSMCSPVSPAVRERSFCHLGPPCPCPAPVLACGGELLGQVTGAARTEALAAGRMMLKHPHCTPPQGLGR